METVYLQSPSALTAAVSAGIECFATKRPLSQKIGDNESVVRLGGVLAFLSGCMLAIGAQITVIDSGSTNVPGMRMTLEGSRHAAVVTLKDGSKQRVKLNSEVCGRVRQDLEAAGPLNELPVAHCAKSVSFGKSIFIEYKGVRTPDLSCRQSDPRAAALKNDAEEILSAARGLNRTKRY
jgi:hypothetical protein